MSKTLNLIDHLLRRARRLHEMGLDHQARHLLERLTGLRELPREAAEEAQHRLARLLSDAEEFGSARRHLAAALVHRPDSAAYHVEMARAIAADETAPAGRARSHFRTALRLEPDNAQTRCEYGLFLVRQGE